MQSLNHGTTRRPRVLVVDDNQDAADSLAALLQSWGCDASTAYDGTSGAALAESLRPDAVLLDLRMPGTNGFDACRAIRAESWAAETVILAVTGSAEDRETALTEAGFDGVFLKPVEPATLQELLTWLRMRIPASASSSSSTRRRPKSETASVSPPA